MTQKTKILAIGLDSADRNLLWEMQVAGELPVIRSLVKRGVWGSLKGPVAMGDDAAWASFSHCSGPGRHGRFFWKTVLPGIYDTPISPDHERRPETFWSQLSSKGFKVGIIDVPKTPLEKIENGFQLCDWLVHGRDGSTRSWPHEIAQQVLTRFGDDQIDRWGSEDFLCSEYALSEELHLKFLNNLNHGLTCKKEASIEFLSQGGWDLFLTVFKESHCVGHEFWHCVDKSHSRFEEPNDSCVNNPVKDVYKKLDNAIGELLQQTDNQTHVVLFSGLGMSSNYTGEHLLDQALIRLEAQLPNGLACRDPKIYNMLLEQPNLLDNPKFRSIRSAYQIPHNELSGAVRINIKGREARGKFTPGNELCQWYEWIEASLLELTDPDTGHTVVDQVIRSDEQYPGKQRDRLPDLFVIWNRDRPITGISSKKIGVIRQNQPDWRSGNHIVDGFYLISGPGIKAAKNSNPVSIMDIGPTIASLLGSSLENIDGSNILANI